MPARSASRSMPSTTARLRMIRSRNGGGLGTMPKPAVSHNRGRYAERRRRRQGWIPSDLGVVMGMYVDDARHQSETAGVDHLGGAPSKVRVGDLADGGNPRIAYR